MDSLTKAINYLKKAPTKMAMAREYAQGNPYKMTEVVPFAPYTDAEQFEEICSFKSGDWMAYGACKEQEYFFNREEKDIPVALRKEDYSKEDRAILTEEQFAEVLKNNPSTALHYDLYKTMASAE
jgi:hypothetical protein